MLSFFAPFLLRLMLGLLFVGQGYLRLTKEREFFRQAFIDKWKESGAGLLFVMGIGEILAGCMLVVGLYTQVASIFGILLAIFALVSTNTKEIFGNEKTFYMLVLVISLSLILTGAGQFAFDLPL